jgi:DnaJ-domain-containing protein 1
MAKQDGNTAADQAYDADIRRLVMCYGKTLSLFKLSAVMIPISGFADCSSHGVVTYICMDTTAAECAPAPGLTQTAAIPLETARQSATDAEHAALFEHCDAITAQFQLVVSMGNAIRRRDALQLDLDTLITAGADLVTIGLAGKELQAAIVVVTQQPMSEEDHLTLADRHEALVQNVTDTCKDLLAAAQYDAVITLGRKLKELQAAKASTEEQVRSAKVAELILSSSAVATQFAHVPALLDAIQTRDELQRELTSLRNDGDNFYEIVSVGTALKAAKTAVAQQALSEAHYLTLTERQAALVQDIKDQCSRLADAEEYDALEALGLKLAEQSACNLQRGVHSAAAAPVAVVLEKPTTAVPETFKADALPAPPLVYSDLLAPALSLPTHAPSTPDNSPDNSPDWVDVADTSSTAISNSENILLTTTDDHNCVAALTALPFSEK